METPTVCELREWIKESREYLDKIEELLEKKCCHLEPEDRLPESVFTDEDGPIILSPRPLIAKGACRKEGPIIHSPRPLLAKGACRFPGPPSPISGH